MTLDRREVMKGAAASLGTAWGLGGVGLALAAPASLMLEAAPTKAGGLAYGGTVPGPLIRVRLGEPVAATLRNALGEPTTVTWHGVRISNASDGVAGLTQPAVAPGGTGDIRFTPPDAGTYWYHPHVAPHTAEQTGRGLHGVLIVDEAEPPAVDADLLLVLGDASAEPGAAVTVNGSAAPQTREARPGARLRLRLCNACVSRIALVAVTGAQPSVIAIDGQPSELFQPPGGTVPLGPGATFELMLDLPAEGASLVLRGMAAGQPDQPLMTIKAAGAALPAKTPIAAPARNPLLPQRIALERSTRRDVAIASAPGGRWTINGVAGMPAKPLFTVKRGAPVTLTIRNGTEMAQSVHVHGHCWRLLHDLDDGWDPFWRTSVLLAPGRSKHVAFVADNPGRWALVGSDLRRQDAGLATWFEVK